MASAKRNVVWIVTTQWRGQATGYAGDPNARTPCLDALAASAINFAEAVTPHPFGPFARAALLTGIPSPQNGVRDYFDPLPRDSRTIAHDLGERGYATAWFGKWHLSKRDPRVPLVGEGHARTIVPAEHRGGFEFWEGFEGGFMLNDPWLHGTRLPEAMQFSGYQSDVLCDRAADWIHERASHSARPWFCVVSLEAPHPPYHAPSGRAPEEAGRVALRPNVPREPAIHQRARRELAGYYAHISATDRAVGRLIGVVAAETIVVVTSVHGDMHGSHGLFRKGWPHEESVRVPLLVRRGAGAPIRDPSPVSLLDLRAMTLAWADGAEWSFARRFAAISMPSVVELPDQCDRIWTGVRSRERKIVWSGQGVPWLVFDLAADPFEMRNLATSTLGRSWAEEARSAVTDVHAPR